MSQSGVILNCRFRAEKLADFALTGRSVLHFYPLRKLGTIRDIGNACSG